MKTPLSGGEGKLALFVLTHIMPPCSEQASKSLWEQVLGLASGQQHLAHVLHTGAEQKGCVASAACRQVQQHSVVLSP